MKNEKVVKHIVSWLKNYTDSNKLKGFIVGISGGIDSALTSVLCAETGLPLLCVEMPIHQQEAEVNRAQVHLSGLTQKYPQVKSLRVDLTPAFDEMTKALTTEENHPHMQLSLANTRARLRMTTLYYYAGLYNYVVAGTGNKIEDFGIGFYTKYGDGGVDISPIADLMKSEVYQLAEFLHIDTSILQAKPTDGLFGDNRSDEEQIGASYPELEWAMQQAESGKTEEDFKGRALEVFKIYQHRHLVNRHKWEPIPVCIIPETLK